MGTAAAVSQASVQPPESHGARSEETDWTFWASHWAAGSVLLSGDTSDTARADQRIHLSADGVTLVELSCPSTREVALGQCSQVQVYSYTGVIVAGDGSLKKDGSMGTAMMQRYLVAQ